MNRVLVTPRSLTRDPGPELARLEAAGYEVVLGPAGRQPTEAELIALLPGCVGYLAGVEPITRRVLEAAGVLRAISRNGAGVDAIDLEVAAEHGIRVERAGGANARGVAELAIALVLAALRHLPSSSAALAAGRWERRLGREAAGLPIGVVGTGAIGREVLGLAAALGMRPLASDVAPPPDLLAAGVVPFLPVEELLASADVVSLHCPPSPDGRPLVGAPQLALARPGLVLVNTARASLVDLDAVEAALDDGRLGAFATDVFAVEPPAPSALLGHPRVIATPHVGGYTGESVARAAAAAVDNLLTALGALPGKVNAPSRREGDEQR